MMEVSVMSSLDPVDLVKVYKNGNLSSPEARRDFVMLEKWIFSDALDMPLHEVSVFFREM